MKEKAKKIWSVIAPCLRRFTPYFYIAIVSIFALSIFLNSGYPDGHDLEYHAASVLGMSNGSFLDVLTNKIMGVISNNFGYGEGLFYPPLAHVCTALIYKIVALFGLNIFAAFRIFYFGVLFFSGTFMYKLILLITRNKRASLFSSFFYITFPYIITDITVRCAMAESTIFVFMPIVLIGLYYLLQNNYRKFLLYFTIGCTGMVHSHLVLTLYFVVFCVAGFLPKIKLFFSKRKILYLMMSIVFTTLLSLPFLLPMLENKSNVDYYVFVPGFMSSVKTLQDWRVPFDALFSIDKPVGDVPVFIGLFGIVVVLYVILRRKKIKEKTNSIYFDFALIIAIISIFCSSTLFSWENVHSVFLLLQFPFRLMTFSAFGIAILLGIAIPTLKSEFGNVIYVLIILSCIYGVCQVNNNISTTKCISIDGLQHSASYVVDYLPYSSPATQENSYVNTQDPNIITTSIPVVISDYISNTPDMSFEISGVSEPTSVTLPRYYYLGYDIEAVYPDGSSSVLDYSMSDDGYVSFLLDSDAKINITYPGTIAQRVSYGVAIISVIVFVGFFMLTREGDRITSSKR